MTATLDLDQGLTEAQAPKFATTRNPAARSHGDGVALIAEVLGTPLMPWQRLVADVATERLPSGGYRYRTVVVTVPRQAGKTTLLRAVAVHRSMTGMGMATYMTAQTGKDAGDRWKDIVSAVERSPIGSQVQAYRGAGAQSLIFPNDSFIRAFAPTPKSIHGNRAHLIMLDEIWAFDQISGEDLFNAVQPTMNTTSPNAQMWMVSTAGTARSAFMREWVSRGRDAIAAGSGEVAYFEWSAADEFDTYDEAGWLFHPALGHTINLDVIRSAASMGSRGNFERAYLNRWTSGAETIVDMDTWAARAADQTPPPAHAVAYAYEVAIDRSGASIFAAWRDTAGSMNVRPYRTGPGTDWLIPTLLDLHRSGASIFADDGGTTRVVTDELRRHDVDVTTLTGRDASTAWAAFKSAITDGTLIHDGSENLTQALEVAAERTHLDTPTLSRKHSAGPIDALIAAVVAAWFADRLRTTLQVF